MKTPIETGLIGRDRGLHGVLSKYKNRDLRIEDVWGISHYDQVITDERTFLGPTHQLLPEQYDFGTHGFLKLIAHIRRQSYWENKSGYTVCPLIATYANQEQRKAVITSAIRSDRAQCKAGAAISSTVKYYPSETGGIGIICSLYETGEHESQWHAVAMLRKKKTVWAFDPAYMMNSQARLSDIPGTANIINLLKFRAFGKVEMVQIQGVGSMDEDCMGRSAQWVDKVLGASTTTQPYPSETFISGVLTHGWQELSI
jgi:hypothetical protein